MNVVINYFVCYNWMGDYMINYKKYELDLYKTSSMKDVNKTVYIVDSYHPTSYGIWEKDEILSCFIRILNKAKEKI